MRALDGKTALITGSATGIGLGIAGVLGGAGARIALNGLPGEPGAEDACRRVRASGAPETVFFDADLRNPDDIDNLMSRVADWGGPDILVNNAGIQATAPLGDMARVDWDAILSVNLSAAFHTMKSAMPGMAERGYGRVINIASVHGLVASVQKAPYVAAKFGLVGLSRVAALEYAQAGTRASGGVTVNCICPGWTETALIEPQIAARERDLGTDRDGAITHLLAEKQPSGRMSRPEEIGELALWLCSPSAHNVTGAAIPVDGGWTSR